MKYRDFIQNIINERGQWGISKKEYFEGHHIVPKCLGGEGKSKRKDKNIIWLYPQEHYEAHRLLALENPDNISIQRAWFAISHWRNNKKIMVKISKEEYAILRQKIAENTKKHFLGKIPWNKGKQNVYSKETLIKMGIKNIGHEPWNKGKPWSEETIKKIQQRKKEQVLRKGEPHLGKHHSENTIKQLSDYFKQNPSHGTQILNETTGELYVSLADCQRKLSIGKKMLFKCLKLNLEIKGQKLVIFKKDETPN